jgi:hypothetical protein
LNEQIKEDVVDGACSKHEEKRNAYRLLMGKQEGKRPLERPILIVRLILKRILENG